MKYFGESYNVVTFGAIVRKRRKTRKWYSFTGLKEIVQYWTIMVEALKQKNQCLSTDYNENNRSNGA